MAGEASNGTADRRLWPWLAAIALIGFALRIAAASGDYWLDEAWSALFAREAGTPGRVFFAINHDNNHYLNTLWLQLAGWGSPPMLGRTLSILCGTAGIVVAGLIGARRNIRVACVTALLFAVSPILVTYGSEARGYAPMLLALLSAIWIVDRELHGAPLRHAPLWLGIVTLTGMLAHASLLFGIAALTGWVAVDAKRHRDWRPALAKALRLMGRAILAVVAVIALALVSAMASSDGFRIGSLASFSFTAFVDALAYMVAFTLGWPLPVPLWLAALLPLSLAAIRHPALHDRLPFLLLAIIGLPLVVLLFRPGNSAFPRYYLLSAIALLLLAAEPLAVRRWFAMIPLYLVLTGCLILDLQIIDNRRADPGVAIDAMAERAPGGAAVLIDNARDSAVLESAAATHGYPLRFAAGCADADFLFAEGDPGKRTSAIPRLCGANFRSISGGQVYGLSGMDWRLYERAR
ncbi:hypothetical protein ASE00_09310 [Sphingomonas sp. Root710]|uniref:hypothetical protein n=1 Tax=Sphingomonas sp. Root710 TaxID=1736594 RepID=UPI0006F508E6|nr:hypothetical protein [Sphingomonas sp. Root710]KRB82274.1 hypothetical protein ASE00_09310 [Sphingomonas sp. Root710]